MLEPFLRFDFAYTTEMQLILLVLTLLFNLYFGYIMTNIILTLFNEKASFKQKLLFSFMTYILGNIAVPYVIYAINGFQSLGEFTYLLTTIPTPLVSLVCYFCSIKVLGLSKYRSIYLLIIFYLYGLIQRCTVRFIGLTFFSQAGEPYNYFLDTLAMLAGILFSAICYLLIIHCIRHYSLGVKISERLFVKSIPRLMLSGLGINCLAFWLLLTVPLLFDNNPFVYLLMSVFFLLCLVLRYYRISSQANRLELQNKSEHIQTLIHSIDEFRSLKHDFYNILMTYSGYIEVDDLPALRKYHEELLNTTVQAGDNMELNTKIEQNPAFVSLLVEKQKYAEQLSVHTRYTISSPIEELFIDNMCLCRALACLLDNAVEGASESSEKIMTFSLCKKNNRNILITITNSTRTDIDVNQMLMKDTTTKPGHNGLGLPLARNILSKFGNCILHFECYNQRFTAYIEICP